MLKKIFFFLCISFFFASSPVFAEEVLVFHFQKTTSGSLLLESTPAGAIEKEDPNFSIVTFSKSAPTSGEYRMDLFDINGEKVDSNFFNTPTESFSYILPHFGIVSSYKVYKEGTGELLIHGSLAEFVTCNNNGICEYEKKENKNTCVSDCGSKALYSKETQEILKNTPEMKASKQETSASTQESTAPTVEKATELLQKITTPVTTLSPSFIMLVITGFVIVFGIVFYLFWKIKK